MPFITLNNQLHGSWNLEVQCRFRNSSPIETINYFLSWCESIQFLVLTPTFKIHCNIVLPLMSRPSVFPVGFPVKIFISLVPTLWCQNYGVRVIRALHICLQINLLAIKVRIEPPESNVLIFVSPCPEIPETVHKDTPPASIKKVISAVHINNKKTSNDFMTGYFSLLSHTGVHYSHNILLKHLYGFSINFPFGLRYCSLTK